MTWQRKPQRPGPGAAEGNSSNNNNGEAYSPNPNQSLATPRDDDLWLREGRYIERAPDWEPVESGSGIVYTALGHMNIHTWRLKVPGGWLYKVTERYELGHFIQLCFVPESQ